MLNGVPKIQNLNYKSTQKQHGSCVVLGKGCFPWHLWFIVVTYEIRVFFEGGQKEVFSSVLKKAL